MPIALKHAQHDKAIVVWKRIATIALFFLHLCLQPTVARMDMIGQSPTFPGTQQSTPYISFRITPDDSTKIQVEEFFDFQTLNNVKTKYRISGELPYVEMDINQVGYVPHDLQHIHSTTYVADTLGLDTAEVLPSTVQVVQQRSFSTLASHDALQSPASSSSSSSSSFSSSSSTSFSILRPFSTFSVDDQNDRASLDSDIEMSLRARVHRQAKTNGWYETKNIRSSKIRGFQWPLHADATGAKRDSATDAAAAAADNDENSSDRYLRAAARRLLFTTKHLSTTAQGCVDKDCTDASEVTYCLRDPNIKTQQQVSDCVNKQGERATTDAAELQAQGTTLQLARNQEYLMSDAFNTLNSTFDDVIVALRAQMALDNNQTDFYNQMLNSFLSLKAEQDTAKNAIEVARAAYLLQVGLAQNQTDALSVQAAQIQLLTDSIMFESEAERLAVQRMINALQQMIVLNSAHIAFGTQQLAFSGSIIRTLGMLLLAMRRQDQTRGEEILQLDSMLTRARNDGWMPWVYNYGQPPLDHLPSAWQVETLGYTDYYYINSASQAVRDHHTLLCNVQLLAQSLSTDQVQTFLDLMTQFSSTPCTGTACKCRILRTRHIYQGNDANYVTASGQRDVSMSDPYAILLHDWLWNNTWSSNITERIPVRVLDSCPTDVFDPSIDSYRCPQSYSVDWAATYNISAAQSLSTNRWTFVHAVWFDTTDQVTTLFQDQCFSALSSIAPTMHTISVNTIPFALDMPETVSTRTYCSTAIDSIIDAMAIGRPFMYVTMTRLVDYFTSWVKLRRTSLQMLLEGYAPSPQVSDSQPFEFFLLENNTIPALLKSRTMYAVAPSVDAEPVYILNRQRQVRKLVLQRMNVDSSGQPSTVDTTFNAISLGNTMLQDVDSVSGLGDIEGVLKWVGYSACLYETCPYKVTSMQADSFDPHIGTISSYRTFTVGNDSSSVRSFSGSPYVLDVPDRLVAISTNEALLRNSATYGFMPLDGATTFGDTDTAAQQVARRYANITGITSRFMTPTLVEWSQTHQGTMDPRHAGVGAATFLVPTVHGPAFAQNPFDIQCTSSRPADSSKCDLMDKYYIDFNLARGTVRFYPRKAAITGVMPMPDLGRILAQPMTTCPDTIETLARPLQQTEIDMTNYTPRKDMYVYIVSTRCDGGNTSTLMTNDGATDVFLNAILANGFRTLAASALGISNTPARVPWVSVQERSMSDWIPYQTHSATVAGCNNQGVWVFASIGSMAQYLVVDSSISSVTSTMRAVADAPSVYSSASYYDAALQTHGTLLQSLQASINNWLLQQVSNPDATFTGLRRCLSGQAPVTQINIQDTTSEVQSQVQYTVDAIADGIRNVVGDLGTVVGLSMQNIDNIINRIGTQVDDQTLADFSNRIQEIKSESDANMNDLFNIIINTNNQHDANVKAVEDSKDLIDSMLTSEEDIDIFYQHAANATILRAQILADEERIVDTKLEPLKTQFSAQKANMDVINYWFDWRQALDAAGGDSRQLAFALGMTSLDPCPVDFLGGPTANTYFFDQDDFLAGNLRPIRDLLWTLIIIGPVLAFVFLVAENDHVDEDGTMHHNMFDDGTVRFFAPLVNLFYDSPMKLTSLKKAQEFKNKRAAKRKKDEETLKSKHHSKHADTSDESDRNNDSDEGDEEAPRTKTKTKKRKHATTSSTHHPHHHHHRRDRDTDASDSSGEEEEDKLSVKSNHAKEKREKEERTREASKHKHSYRKHVSSSEEEDDEKASDSSASEKEEPHHPHKHKQTKAKSSSSSHKHSSNRSDSSDRESDGSEVDSDSDNKTKRSVKKRLHKEAVMEASRSHHRHSSPSESKSYRKKEKEKETEKKRKKTESDSESARESDVDVEVESGLGENLNTTGCGVYVGWPATRCPHPQIVGTHPDWPQHGPWKSNVCKFHAAKRVNRSGGEMPTGQCMGSLCTYRDDGSQTSTRCTNAATHWHSQIPLFPLCAECVNDASDNDNE
jgi:hypothetical protein